MRYILFVSVLALMAFPAKADSPATTPAATASAAAPAPSAAKGNLSVVKLSVGTAIDNKELSGEATEFTSVGKVYAWAKVSAEQAPADIKFLWTVDGNKEAEVPVTVKYPEARLWSSKNVWPGSWKVAVMDGDKSFAEVSFTIK